MISHKLCVKAESLTCKAFYFQFYRRLAPGLVGSAGFEPTASCSQSKRSARLDYNPMESKSLATLARFTDAENSKKARKVSVTMNHDFYTYNATPFGVPFRQIRKAGCAGWTCTTVLLGMSQASYSCSTAL